MCSIRAIQSGSFDGSNDPYDKLTQREKQVLQLIAHGKSNKEIAVMLDLSVNTVAVHRANLMSTLGVHKTAELVLFAVKKGPRPAGVDGHAHEAGTEVPPLQG